MSLAGVVSSPPSGGARSTVAHAGTGGVAPAATFADAVAEAVDVASATEHANSKAATPAPEGRDATTPAAADTHTDTGALASLISSASPAPTPGEVGPGSAALHTAATQAASAQGATADSTAATDAPADDPPATAVEGPTGQDLTAVAAAPIVAATPAPGPATAAPVSAASARGEAAPLPATSATAPAAPAGQTPSPAQPPGAGVALRPMPPRTAPNEGVAPASSIPVSPHGAQTVTLSALDIPASGDASTVPVGTSLAPAIQTTPSAMAAAASSSVPPHTGPSTAAITSFAAPSPSPAAPAAPAAPATPAPLAPQLAGTVVSLAQAPAGDHRISLTVSPENLGPVTVRAHIDGGVVRIELHAPTEAGREAVRAILTDLRRDLAGAAPQASLTLATGDAASGGTSSNHSGGGPAQTGGAQTGGSPAQSGSGQAQAGADRRSTTSGSRRTDLTDLPGGSIHSPAHVSPAGIDIFA